MIKTISASLLTMAMMLTSCSSATTTKSTDTNDDKLLLLTGSYSDAANEGINLYEFDQSTGESRRLTGLKGISNPSFVIFNADGTKIYSVGEDPGSSSTVNTIAFDRDSLTMKLIDSSPTGGGAPCHVALSPDGTHVLTANYMGGNATIYPLDSLGVPYGEPQVIRFTGTGPDKERQSQPHAHFATFTPDGRHLWVTDLGTDRIHTFPVTGGKSLIDTTAMADITVAPKAGPRHVAFHPSLKRAYLIDEIDGQVNVIDIESASPKIVQRIAADSVGAEGSGDIHLTPDGRHLYASNRLKADGLAIFKVDGKTGLLTRTGYQPTAPHPRNFAITPNGRFLLLASRDGNVIEIYSIDPETGALTPTDKSISTSKPVCLKFFPRG